MTEAEKKPHILHLESSPGWGGQDIRVFLELREFTRKGYKTILICQPESPLAQRVKRENLKSCFIKMKGTFDLIALFKILQIVRKEGINIIHTHSSIDSWLGAIIKNILPGILLVRTRHVSIEVKKNLRTKWLYHQADFTLTTGEFIREYLIRHLGLKKEKSISIPTGVDLEIFNPLRIKKEKIRKEIGIADGLPLIGIIAVLRSWKGHTFFLKAAKKILALRSDLIFLIVGDGPQRDNLLNLSRSLNISSQVKFLGHRDDIKEILAALDLVVLSSYCSEGIPQVILQALAMKKPVVATAVGGIPEVIKNGYNGILVRPQNSEELKEGILKILAAEGLKKKLVENSRKIVEEKFSLPEMIKRIEKVYNDLLDR